MAALLSGVWKQLSRRWSSAPSKPLGAAVASLAKPAVDDEGFVADIEKSEKELFLFLLMPIREVERRGVKGESFLLLFFENRFKERRESESLVVISHSSRFSPCFSILSQLIDARSASRTDLPASFEAAASPPLPCTLSC